MTPNWAQWRTRRLLTQEQLADLVGVDRATLSHLETGKRLPSLHLLQRLCIVLELTAEERLEAAGLSGAHPSPRPEAEGEDGAELGGG